MKEIINARRMAMRAVLLTGLCLAGLNIPAQENRKAIVNPAPVYPETAKRFRIAGVVKVQVVIAQDGHITETKVIGGHPLFVNAVQETLKNWKYAPASSETRLLLEFSFRP